MLWLDVGATCRQRIARAAAATVAAVLVYRGVLFATVRMWRLMPFQFYGPFGPHNEALIDTFGRHAYLGFLTRLSPFTLGILAALAVSDVGARELIAR